MTIAPIQMMSQLASAVAPTTQIASADPAQIDKFRASLSSVMPTDSVAQPDAVANGSAVSATNANAPASLGDEILRGLDHVRNRMSAGWSEAVGHIDPSKGPMNTPELLQFQAGMLQMGFEHQLIGSIAGKATQGIDQLVKMQ